MQSVANLLSRVIQRDNVGGGCISRSERVVVTDEHGGRRSLFVKSRSREHLCMFEAEVDGLERLADATDAIDGLHVPRALACGNHEDRAMLVLPWLEADACVDEVRLADALARLHLSTEGDRIGLERDNFLGSAVQPNSPSDRWSDFFAEQRLGFQIQWAKRQHFASAPLIEDVEKIMGEMASHWPESSTSLLHGDLWSGNVMQSTDQVVFLIDPAVYYGPVEMDLGMIRLFGSVGDSFWHHYLHRNPLAGGWSHRVDLAMLYHLLNHLNLFGEGYRRQCETLARRLAEANF